MVGVVLSRETDTELCGGREGTINTITPTPHQVIIMGDIEATDSSRLCQETDEFNVTN